MGRKFLRVFRHFWSISGEIATNLKNMVARFCSWCFGEAGGMLRFAFGFFSVFSGGDEQCFPATAAVSSGERERERERERESRVFVLKG